MALAQQTIMKEQTIDQSMIKFEENELLKRRKRLGDKDENQYLPQKKRATSNSIENRRQNSTEEQDDEALIRETQAALKSLSSSWPESCSPIYKMNEMNENPAFQNLFEEKNNNNNSNNNSNNTNNNTKMSPTSTTPTIMSNLNSNACNEQQFGYTYRDQNGKIRPDMKSLQKYRRDKDEPNRSKTNFGQNQQYQSYDFNELVDDSSTDIQLNAAGAFNENQKDETFNQNQLLRKSEDKFKEFFRNDMVYGNYQSRVPFSQSSAFRPPGDRKVLPNAGVPVLGPYHNTDPNYAAYASDISAAVCANEDKDKFLPKLGLEEQPTPKSLESPDSKQYTVLQPAGVGSKAASVIQDIVREGVVSVAAVSSTSSPGLNNIPTTIAGEKGNFDRMVPSFSPGSINKGKSFNLKQLFFFLC